MSIISDKDFEKLYLESLISLGHNPKLNNLKIEVDKDVFIVKLETSIQDYNAFINDWLIQQQWGNLQNLHIDKADLVFALTTKSLDFENSFSIAYGKQTGISTNGSWELKKDYITVSGDTQVYSIPAEREVNEVLWYTPPQIGIGISNPLGVQNWSMNMNGWNYAGSPAQSVLPTYGLLLSNQDMAQKRKILQSELTYRITPGPDGTKNLYLYPVPGSKDEIGGVFGRHYDGAKVFYFYYDTNTLGRKKCLEDNNDIIKTPNDIPIGELGWGDLNVISKSRVRRLTIAELKSYLGMIRGKWSGEMLGPNDSKLKMDYSFLLDQAKDEKEKVYEEITKSLEFLTWENIMKQKASIAQSLNDVLKYVPSRVQFYRN